MRIKTLALAAAATAVLAGPAAARDEIRIVGSSTVFPFSTKVAQEYQAKTGQKVVVESTGSGGGHKLFCAGVGAGHPDITNSSRRQKKSEFDKCQKAGVKDIVEVTVGYDGIVIANANGGPKFELGLKDVYLAFAESIAQEDGDKCTLVPNSNAKWSDIRSDLPGVKIEAYGPPPTSGTRDAFSELAMEGGGKKIGCLKTLRKAKPGKDGYDAALAAFTNLPEGMTKKDGKPLKGKKIFKALTHTLREDGSWIDAGENDNAIVQTLVRTPAAVGIFGFSFLDQNADKIKGASIEGTTPSFDSISAGEYPVSRSLFFYIKKQHVTDQVAKGIHEYALEFTSEAAYGPGGYLEKLGLIPLPDAKRAEVRKAVEDLTPYSQ